MRIRTGLATTFLTLSFATGALAQDGPGARFGVGTDISGGLAFGGAFTYTRDLGPNAVELGLTFFRASTEETSNNGFHDYNEQTDVSVFAVTSNWLFGFGGGVDSVYMIAGVGAGAFSVEYQETSPTDTSLGSGSEEGSAGGTILNVGVGKRFSETVDFRVEAPIFFIFDVPGEASSVAPTLTLTGGVRF